MRIPLLKTLALAATVGLASTASAQTPTVLFNFEGAGGDTQGWEPDQAPDQSLGANAQSKVQTLDKKAVGGGESINAFNGTWLLEGVANRPILAYAFRGMKYTWSTPQNWSATPILKLAASMQANGPNSRKHEYRVRVIAGTQVKEMIFVGDKNDGVDGTPNNSFVNDWQVLTIDLSDFAGVGGITSIEAAGRHADDETTEGTPKVAQGGQAIDGANWGGTVHLDYVTIEAKASGVANEGDQPGLRSLSNAYPNPSAVGSTLDLAVETPQQVTARVVDVLGRTVQTAFAGAASPGAVLPIRVDASRLSAGTYVVVVEGETFRQSRRLTVTR